ncbi:MAG: sel1 repeat family protein [Robiginitomaculum sp.]|nr:sel1 repeat family protein [Robiginitomaculum sp.]
MKTTIIAITLGLTLAACGGETPSKKDLTTKELVAAAAAGDEGAMRALERQIAKKTKAEKKKIDTKASAGDPLSAFQKALTSGDGNEERINVLADNGNPNAQQWNAVSNAQNSDLSLKDKQKYRTNLERIAGTGNQYSYQTFGGAPHNLSAEAAFNIAQDMLHNKGLYAQDTDVAITYLKQAAEGGQPEAMFKLATRYQYALDMDKDMTKAKHWLEKSANASNRDAKTALANWKNE